jgi:hypothetical protein
MKVDAEKTQLKQAHASIKEELKDVKRRSGLDHDGKHRTRSHKLSRISC